MSKKRLLYLDNLKVCLTVLLIFHHAGQAYGNGGAWAYHPSNPAEFMPWIWHFFSVNAAFFMGLFFLISGYFVPTSFDKQGAKVFVKKKLIRLGIPLLLMGGLIAVLSGKPEIAHMWYIESLACWYNCKIAGRETADYRSFGEADVQTFCQIFDRLSNEGISDPAELYRKGILEYLKIYE